MIRLVLELKQEVVFNKRDTTIKYKYDNKVEYNNKQLNFISKSKDEDFIAKWKKKEVTTKVSDLRRPLNLRFKN